METIQLNIASRQGTGKEKAGRLRRGGKVPGVLYGSGKTAEKVCVDAREFRYKLAGLEGAQLIQFLSPLPELNEKIVLLKELQRHPVTDDFLHIDFYEVDLKKPLQATVSLHFTGKPKGVTAGGILQPVRREVAIECLPGDIPEFIEVDVSELGIHDTIHVADLSLPAAVRVVSEPHLTVVTVAAPTVIREAEAEEAPTPEEAAPTPAPTEAEAPAEAEQE